MSRELPIMNAADAQAVKEAGLEGPDALEVLMEVRRQHHTIPTPNKKTGREFARRTEEIEAEIAQLKKELLRSKAFNEQVTPAELGSAIRDIRSGNFSPKPRPVFVIESMLKELAEELDRSTVFN